MCSEDVVEEGDEAEVMQDLLLLPQRRTMSQGFASLDCVNLEEVMKTVPMFMKGAFRAALQVCPLVESSLEHAMNGTTATAKKRRRSKNDMERRTAKGSP